MAKKIWTTITLTEKQLCYLDSISKKCKFSGGRKMSRTAILRSIIQITQEIDIDVDGVKSQEELSERILESFKATC